MRARYEIWEERDGKPLLRVILWSDSWGFALREAERYQQPGSFIFVRDEDGEDWPLDVEMRGGPLC